MHLCVYGRMNVWVHGCMDASMCLHVCTYVPRPACLPKRMHGCMYVGMYVDICTGTHNQDGSKVSM